MEGQEESKNDLFIRLKVNRNNKGFEKSEESDNIDLISMEVTQKENQGEEIIELNIHLQKRKEAKQTTN